MLYLALSLAPVAFLFTLVYLGDKYEREPLRYLIITYILGIFIAAPVILLGIYLSDLLGVDSTSTSISELLIYAFLVVGISEEGMKYLILRYYNYPHKEFDEPYDGIMYGVAISLGFASIENVLYVFMSQEPLTTGLMRMFTAVPAHAMFGVLMGYFAGKAKFLTPNKSLARQERLKGLGVAILFHGTYDFFLFLGVSWLVPFAIICLVLGISLALKAIRLHADQSPFRDLPPSDTI